MGTIEAGAVFTHSFDIRGLLLGSHQLVAGLDSDQVEMVSGEAEITVDEGEEEEPPVQPEEVEVVSVDRNLTTNHRVSHHLNCYCLFLISTATASFSSQLLLPPDRLTLTDI